MPSKIWVIGEEVLAADWNAFVQEQVVSTFASASARASAIPSPKNGQFSYLQDSNTLHVFFGGAWSLPWSQPWGLVVPLKSSTGITLQTGVQAIPGTAGTVIPVPIGRAVRFVVHGTCANVGAAADVKIGIQRDVTPTEYYGAWLSNIGGGAGAVIRNTVHVEAIYKTVKANQVSQAVGITGANTALWESGTFYVEDLGPAPAALP